MSKNKEKGILVEADPEPERTLKRKLREVNYNNPETTLLKISNK